MPQPQDRGSSGVRPKVLNPVSQCMYSLKILRRWEDCFSREVQKETTRVLFGGGAQEEEVDAQSIKLRRKKRQMKRLLR